LKLDRETGPANLIRGYHRGELLVGGETLRQAVILSADTIVRAWSPPAVAELGADDLRAAFALQPDVILLGTGERQVFPPAALAHDIMSRGVGLEVMATAAACRTFNVLASENRRVVAALYVD